MLEPQSDSIGEVVSPPEAEAIAASAYIFGFPLVLFERVHAAVAKPTANIPGADDRPPSVFCLDLGQTTFVLRISDLPLEIRDAWSNVIASFGRAGPTGDAPRAIALIRRGWRGPAPAAPERLSVPTDLVFVIAPGSANPLVPALAGVSPASLASAIEQVSRMGAGTFLSRLARLMRHNPPAADDDPLLARLRRIGIAPGEPTRLACLPGDLKRALVSGVAAGRAAMADRARTAPRKEAPGRCDYSGRALWASTSLLGIASGQLGFS